jgi:ABC-type phosphate transport system auxiliary subunit
MNPSAPEASPRESSSDESAQQELRKRLSDIDQRLSVSYEAEEKVEADIRKLNQELERLEISRHELLTERSHIEKKMNPEIFA